MFGSVVLLTVGGIAFVGGALMSRHNKRQELQRHGETTESNARKSVEGFSVVAGAIPEIAAPALAGIGALMIAFALASVAIQILT